MGRFSEFVDGFCDLIKNCLGNITIRLTFSINLEFESSLEYPGILLLLLLLFCQELCSDGLKLFFS